MASQFFNVSVAWLTLIQVSKKRWLTMQLKESTRTHFPIIFSWQHTFFGHCFKQALGTQVGFPSSVLVITWRSTELAIFEDGWPNSIRDPLLAAWRHRRLGGLVSTYCSCLPGYLGRWSNLTKDFSSGVGSTTNTSIQYSRNVAHVYLSIIFIFIQDIVSLYNFWILFDNVWHMYIETAVIL